MTTTEASKTTSHSAPILDSITIDCVIFGFNQGSLEVLLVKHADGISKDKWGLPGGCIYTDESTDDAANRLLLALTGIKDIYLEQLNDSANNKNYILIESEGTTNIHPVWSPD